MATTIAHFTDIHITAAPGSIPWRLLASKRLAGWINLSIMGRYRALRDAADVTRAAVSDLEALQPDQVLFTGDVTGLALPSEFEEARGILAPLLADSRVTGIPGNHDLYVNDAVREGYFDRAFGPWTRTDLAPENLPAPLRGSYPYPLLRLVGEDVAIVCLRDSRPTAFHDSSGRVNAAQLVALEHILEMPEVRGRTRVLALHYGLCRADGSPDTFFHRLHNADAVRRLADEREIDLVVHGHIHRRFVHQAGTVARAAIANPGALAHTAGSRAYHLFTIEGGVVTLAVRRFDDATGSFQPWPDAPGSGVLCRRGDPSEVAAATE